MLEIFDTNTLYYAMITGAGLLTGLAYAIGGSGGLIITPLLISLGMPIHTAIGSAKMGSIGLLLTVFLKFKTSTNHIQKSYLLPLSIIATTGAAIGAQITLSLDKDVIYPIVGAFLVLLSPLAMMKKDFGLQSFTPNTLQRTMGYTSFGIVMIFGGFFGAGAGIPGILALVSFLGFTIFQAHSTLSIPFLIVNITSSALFALYGYIDYIAVIILLGTMTIGGWVGTKLALHKGEKFVKVLTCLFAFCFGIKMISESFF